MYKPLLSLVVFLTLLVTLVGSFIGMAVRPTHATVNGQGTPYLIGAADSAQCGLILVRGGNFPMGIFQPVVVTAPDGTMLTVRDPAGAVGLYWLANLRDSNQNKFGNFQILLQVHPTKGTPYVVLSARFPADPWSYSGAPDYQVPLGPACG